MAEQQRQPINDDHDNLENWWPGTPEEELREGYQEGWYDASERMTRVELVTVAATLKNGRAAFFETLRDTDMLRDEPAANGTFAEFERLMFGPFGGGIQGDYASGYIRAFVTYSTFVTSLH